MYMNLCLSKQQIHKFIIFIFLSFYFYRFIFIVLFLSFYFYRFIFYFIIWILIR